MASESEIHAAIDRYQNDKDAQRLREFFQRAVDVAYRRGQAEEFGRANAACQQNMERLAKRMQAETLAAAIAIFPNHEYVSTAPGSAAGAGHLSDCARCQLEQLQPAAAALEAIVDEGRFICQREKQELAERVREACAKIAEARQFELIADEIRALDLGKWLEEK